MADTNNAISVLNNLIETCKDGQEGFKKAAEDANAAQLKTLFNEYAQQRGQFASELQAEVRKHGGEAEQTGSVSAAVHRGWISIREKVANRTDEAIVAECERGEDYAKAAYEDAMKEDLPADCASIVQRQYGGVKAAHDRIRDMKHANEAKA